MGALLHGLRVAAAVHEHNRNAEFCRRWERVVAKREGGDVVDDIRSGRDRGSHDGRLAGVDGNQRRGLWSQTLDHRNDAGDFVVGFDQISARARALATDVEDVGASVCQGEGVVHRTLERHEPSAVGKAVRRDVDNAHHAGAVE